MGSYQNRSSIFYIINKWVNSTLTCLTHNNDVGYNLLCWLNQRFNQRKKMIVSGCYSIGGAEVTYICHSMRLLIVRRNYSIPKQHKLANNFLNQKTLVAHTKWQDPMNNFEWIIFLKMMIRHIHKMTHVAFMVATQPITYPYTLASRSQLKMTRFIIYVKTSSILTQTRLTYKNKCHFYPV